MPSPGFLFLSSPSSLIMFRRLSSSSFPLLLPTAQPCPGLQHYCNKPPNGVLCLCTFPTQPPCVFHEQYAHCLPPQLTAFPITGGRVKSKLCLLFRTLQRAGHTSQPGILTAVKPSFSLPPQPGTQSGSPHSSLPSRDSLGQECLPSPMSTLFLLPLPLGSLPL